MEIKIDSYREYYKKSKESNGPTALKRILNSKTLEELNKAIEWSNNQACLDIFSNVEPVKKEHDLEYQKHEKAEEIERRMYWQYVIKNAMASSAKGTKVVSTKNISTIEIKKNNGVKKNGN